MNIQTLNGPPIKALLTGESPFAQVRVKEERLQKSVEHLLSLQRSDGYWWFTLEANESIGAEFVFLMHYLGAVDSDILKGIARRIMDVQRQDGTWAIFFDGPPCLSTTIECYFALKLAGVDTTEPHMTSAREFILKSGGIEKARVFTKIHLAMFGLCPWGAAPAMPVEFIFMPSWFPFNIYEFSSWARATIVPLLVFMSKRRHCKIDINLDELFCNPPWARDYSFKTEKPLISWEFFFIYLDKILKIYEKSPLKPFRNLAYKKALKWIKGHIEKTEDIYPALAYGALAFKAFGYETDAPEIAKPFSALKMFHQAYATLDVPVLPPEIRDNGKTPPSKLRELGIDPVVSGHEPRATSDERRVHQQCCISPVWDTPWTLTALLDAGVPPKHPALIKAGQWLLAKQIMDVKGDWAVKNPKAQPGGWAFEFENDYFPDVDDTIQVLSVIHRLPLPMRGREKAFRKGLSWLISMQNSDGGWGAFDKNQTQGLVNRIPFSDHGACLDSSSPDITGRMIEFLSTAGFGRGHDIVRKALGFIFKTQEPFGAWFARWGINCIYGTWCVLTGLCAVGFNSTDPRVSKAVTWLASVQRPDGGFGESPLSYNEKCFVPLNVSVPSQTAWALMGLVAGGFGRSDSAKRAVGFLLNNQNEDASWIERHHTGTGFPGHFYIRYHGYRHYFPLLALGRYLKCRRS